MSSSIGTGYDLSSTTYSPDGRVFQVEYAQKAVENSGNAIGLKVKDGIVFGVEKLIVSKMLEKGSNRRIESIDRHVGMTFAGLSADARQLVSRGRSEAKQYKQFYQNNIPGRILSERLSAYVHAYTLYGSVRPFGCSILLASYDKDGHHLHCLEPSGVAYEYYAAAVGKAKGAAKGELEKLKLKELTCREALLEVAKIINTIHDDVKDKDFELELSWLCEETKWTHQLVPQKLVEEMDQKAKQYLEEMDDM